MFKNKVSVIPVSVKYTWILFFSASLHPACETSWLHSSYRQTFVNWLSPLRYSYLSTVQARHTVVSNAE